MTLLNSLWKLSNRVVSTTPYLWFLDVSRLFLVSRRNRWNVCGFLSRAFVIAWSGAVFNREKSLGPNDILGSLICFKWWVFQKPVLPDVICVPRGMRSSAERRELWSHQGKMVEDSGDVWPVYGLSLSNWWVPCDSGILLQELGSIFQLPGWNCTWTKPEA